MKKSMIFVGLLAIGFAYAQEGNVGINTDQPKATLDIQPSAGNLSKTTNEGILAPRLSKSRVANIAEPVQGTMVYVLDENSTEYPNALISAYTGTDSKVAKITEKGYYFYNGTEWVKIQYHDNGSKWTNDIGTNRVKLTHLSDGTTSRTDNKAFEILDAGTLLVALDGKFSGRGAATANENTGLNLKQMNLTNGNGLSLKFSSNTVTETASNMKASIGVIFKDHNTGETDMLFGTNNGKTYTEKMRLKADGSLGINTDDPKAKLEIKGLGDGTNLLRLNSERPWVFRQVGSEDKAYLTFQSEVSDKNFDITSKNNNSVASFFVSDNLDKQKVILVGDGGNVGIGTKTPSEKLEVDGKIKASSLAQTGAGDRVVYADENGVLKAGVAASANVKLATANNVECTEANTGTMNFGSVTINGKATEAFGFCMKNSTGEYKWYYIYGGAGITTGSGAFGSNL